MRMYKKQWADKLKILFVIPSLRGGGAERVIVTLLKHLDRKRFELHLALVKKEGVYLVDVPQDISIHDLQVNQVRYVFLPLLKLIWHLRPNIVMSTMFHLNLPLLILRPFFPADVAILVRETIMPSEIMKTKKLKVLWKYLYKNFYHKADKIICQSNNMIQDVASYANLSKGKLIQIYNPVDESTIHELAQKRNPFAEHGQGPHFVCAGRLAYQKNFELLISVLPKWVAKCSTLQVWILGEGELEKELKEQTARLGVDKMVHFIGFQQHPYSWFKHAHLYILCSRFEGLPNALLEAIACGCPVLVVEHPGGTKEIMELCNLHNNYVSELPQDIEEVLLKYSAKSSLGEAFKLENIIRQYTELFENVVKN